MLFKVLLFTCIKFWNKVLQIVKETCVLFGKFWKKYLQVLSDCSIVPNPQPELDWPSVLEQRPRWHQNRSWQCCRHIERAIEVWLQRAIKEDFLSFSNFFKKFWKINVENIIIFVISAAWRILKFVEIIIRVILFHVIKGKTHIWKLHFSFDYILTEYNIAICMDWFVMFK